MLLTLNYLNSCYLTSQYNHYNNRQYNTITTTSDYSISPSELLIGQTRYIRLRCVPGYLPLTRLIQFVPFSK